MKQINLIDLPKIHGAVTGILQVIAHEAACHSVMEVWADNYLHCTKLHSALASFRQWSVFPNDWISAVEASLPDHMKTCISWDSYKAQNLECTEFCK